MKTEMFQSIQEFLIGKMDPSFIIVFGSYAKDSIHKDSNIDVAFYSQVVSPSSYLLGQELADLLKIEADLVNLETASTVFQL